MMAASGRLLVYVGQGLQRQAVEFCRRIGLKAFTCSVSSCVDEARDLVVEMQLEIMSLT